MLSARARRPQTRASAAIEFALVAPVAIALMTGVYDLGRGFIVWERTCNAAQAIAEAAEKLSVTVGTTTTTLTATQMQNAMSTVYAQMPGLSLGDGSGGNTGFTVTLSSVVFLPACSTVSGCAPQTPYTAWSTYLTQPGVVLGNPPLRPCGQLIPVSHFPDDRTQLTKVASWSNGSLPVTPQVVANVQAFFVPLFSVLTGPVTFWSSATLPTPAGSIAQSITFNATSPTGNVQLCSVPS